MEKSRVGKTWLQTWRDTSLDRIRKSRTEHSSWAWHPFSSQILQRVHHILLAIKLALHQQIGRMLQPLRSQVQLLDWHQVEECYREPGICCWYRAQDSTPWQCFASIFTATNETCNFWTHFVPVFYFLWRWSQISKQMKFTEDWYAWPYHYYMTTSCLYPFVSSMAHALSAMSNKARHICFFFDYAAISLYSFGAGILYRAYVLPDRLLSSPLSPIFLYGCLLNSVICTILACLSRFTEKPLLQKGLRIGSFAIPYLWDTAPLVYRLISCSDTSDQALTLTGSNLCQTSTVYHKAQLLAAVAACFFYGSNLPERILPGNFDLIGNSHNLLHVFGVAATALQLEGALLDMQEREVTLIKNGWALGPVWSCATTASAFCLNILIVTVFSRATYRTCAETSKYGTKSKLY